MQQFKALKSSIIVIIISVHFWQRAHTNISNIIFKYFPPHQNFLTTTNILPGYKILFTLRSEDPYSLADCPKEEKRHHLSFWQNGPKNWKTELYIENLGIEAEYQIETYSNIEFQANFYRKCPNLAEIRAQ